MQKRDIREKPRYFIAAFAFKHYDTDPVDGGHYPVGPPVSRRDLDVRKGDVMLLYFCGGRPPYGYKRVAVMDGQASRIKLEPDESTAPVVRAGLEPATP